MDMKVKSGLIRKIRSEKLWSQEQLIGDEGQFDGYRHTQRGDHVLIILFVVFTFVLSISGAAGGLDAITVGTLSVVMLVIAILFGSLTIEINDEFICWHFGPGFWKKRLALADIRECRSVENALWWGFGIRNYGAGWLYNVSGIHAVELQLASGAVLRLGTDEPNFLKAAIDESVNMCSNSAGEN